MIVLWMIVLKIFLETNIMIVLWEIVLKNIVTDECKATDNWSVGYIYKMTTTLSVKDDMSTQIFNGHCL